MKLKNVKFSNFNLNEFNENVIIIVPALFYNFRFIAKNYFESAINVKINNKLLFCTNQKEMYNFLAKEKMPVCFFKKLKTCNYSNRLEWLEVERYLKTNMVLSIIKNIKCDFITSDADIFFHKNPIPYILKNKKNFDYITISDKRYTNIIHFKLHHSAFITDQEKFGSLNAAFCFWKNNETTKNAFQYASSILNKYPKNNEAGAAQTIFNDLLLKYKKSHNIKIKELHPFLFVNGFTLINSNEKNYNKRYLTHFNFVSRDLEDINKEIAGKIKLLKDNNLWII